MLPLSNEGHKKAVIYKCSLVYIRAEWIEGYGGSNQVSLRGNSDNVYYKSTPKDCQSERVGNPFAIPYTRQSVNTRHRIIWKQ